MSGYSAHIGVDLSHALAALGTKPENALDFFTIVDRIAQQGPTMVDATKSIYGGDLGPMWRGYFVGEGLDLVVGKGVASGWILRMVDVGLNSITFTNGLALQNPALVPATEVELDLEWRSADLTWQILSALRGL